MRGAHGPYPRRRWLYALWGMLVIGLGLGSRSAWLALPAFVSKYAADGLWALLVFLGIGFLLPTQPTGRVATLAVAFSCAIEFSQLYHAPWIDALRRHPLGALVLGDTFAWADLVAYGIGIACGAVVEYTIYRIRSRKRT